MQESGVPNVYGQMGSHSHMYPSGFLYVAGAQRDNSSNNWVWSNDTELIVNLSRASNQYQSINEVRVKSLISIGFIKLY